MIIVNVGVCVYVHSVAQSLLGFGQIRSNSNALMHCVVRVLSLFISFFSLFSFSPSNSLLMENASLFFLFYISSIFHWCILSTCQFFHIYVYYDVCIFPFYLIFVAFFSVHRRHCLLSLCIIIILIFIFNAKVDALGMNCRHFMRWYLCSLYVLFIWYEMTSTEFVLCVRWHIFLL